MTRKNSAWRAGFVLVLAGCGGGPGGELGEQLAAWEDDAAAHAPFGRAATFDLSGTEFRVRGEGTPFDVAAPFDLIPASAGYAPTHVVAFEGAVVDGVGAGWLVVEGCRLEVEAGQLTGVAAADAIVGWEAVVRLRDDPTATPPVLSLPDDWSAAEQTLSTGQATLGRVEGARLSGFDRAVLVDGGTVTELTDEIAVSADRMWWSAGGYLAHAALEVPYDRFAIAGDVTSGSLAIDGADVGTPTAMFGHGTVALADGRLSSADARVTQAIDADGHLLVDAAVEVMIESSEIRVEKGESLWVAGIYRETTYGGDSLLEDVVVEGSGAAMIRWPVREPELLVVELWEDVAEAGWAAPILAIPTLIATPFVLMVDIASEIACAATDCPEDYPYPMWMGAGETGYFYFLVTAPDDKGTFDATITLVGRNHADVEIPITIVVK